MNAEQRLFEQAWEAAGQRVAALIDGVSAVAVVGDDPVATRAVASGIAQAQAMHRRVFLAHLMPADDDEIADDRPGISDMIRYGVSLGRCAVPSRESPNIFHLHPGVEGIFDAELLGDRRWFTLSEEIHRAGALLLVSTPAGVPELGRLLAQLDGVLTVGEAIPTTGARLLGEVRTGATLRTPAVAVTPPAAPGHSSRRWILAAAAGATLLLALPQVRAALGFGPDPFQASLDSVSAPAITALPEIAPRVTSDAAWSAEVRFLNSRVDAYALVSTLGDSIPGATFSPVKLPGDTTTWFRVTLGAFPDSLSAENFLAAMRGRGVVPVDGGGVTHAPFALLVDSALDNAMARVKVAGYQGRQLPAYALRDSTNVWRVYVGAFTTGTEAEGLTRDLGALNIQSTLVVRVGSTS